MILVTGASGFVGARFVELWNHPDQLRLVSLREVTPEQIDYTGVDAVLHFAGIAHRMHQSDDSLYYNVNRDLTIALAKKAKENGVSHFIFLSTIKVFGKDASDSILNLQTPCFPGDPYGKSKLEAENGLLKLLDDDFSVAILRPPLVYGPGVKGNLNRLMHWIKSSSFPVLLSNCRNQRSMIYVDNLIAYIVHILRIHAAGIFLTTDGWALSTRDLVENLIEEIRPSKNKYVIPHALFLPLRLIRPGIHKRLFGSLVVDGSETDRILDYREKAIENGIQIMAREFKTK